MEPEPRGAHVSDIDGRIVGNGRSQGAAVTDDAVSAWFIREILPLEAMLILGNPNDGELEVDWGVSAAVLFGRQKPKHIISRLVIITPNATPPLTATCPWISFDCAQRSCPI